MSRLKQQPLLNPAQKPRDPHKAPSEERAPPEDKRSKAVEEALLSLKQLEASVHVPVSGPHRNILPLADLGRTSLTSFHQSPFLACSNRQEKALLMMLKSQQGL